MDLDQNIYTLRAPENALPVIFDSPHSGKIYPSDFKYACQKSALEKIEDRYVDDLFSAAPDLEATLLCALFPRSYIDVNRAVDDIDHTLIEGVWPNESHGPARPTARSDSGIGLISRLIKPGFPIYDRNLSADEIMNRVKTYYEPYHNALCNALDDAYYRYGQFWHINCHSMPASSAYPKRHITMIGQTQKPSDIVLGDLDGTTSSRDFVHTLRDYWKNLGYRVTINDPFKGVELVSRYSQPTRGKNSVQIEINRSLYMNEETGEKIQNYDEVKRHCTNLISHCTAFAQSHLTNLAAD